MTSGNLSEEMLLARFDLIEIGGEGVLIDRTGGSVYRLNRTGYDIWAKLTTGMSLSAIVDDLTQRFGLAREAAAHDAMSVLSNLPEVPCREPTNGFRWAQIAGGYGFFQNEDLVWSVQPHGDSLRLRSGLHPTESEARIHLKSVVPKLLTLRGIRVLHASAVSVDGGLLVFSGRSGAGKTTSARAFAQSGGSLVSEDLLIISTNQEDPEGVVGGEARIRAWVADRARDLAADPEQPIACAALDECLLGERLPVTQILLVDADRRSGERIVGEKLSPADALIALIEGAFFASNDTVSWRATFRTLRAIVGSVTVARVTMPKGLGELCGAARTFRYNEMTAS